MIRRQTWSSLVLLAVVTFSAAGAMAQTATNEALNTAQMAVQSAEAAGAATLAPVLYEEARWRAAAAQENWNAVKSSKKNEARLRAKEALWAARAASAKAQWLGTNAAIRDLQTDINRFGGKSDVKLPEESAALALTRGATSKDRIAYAQAAIDQAKAAGAASIVGGELDDAAKTLETARKIVKGTRNSESADHIAYVSEMTARRAYYLAKAQDARRTLPAMQAERTRFAQAESERQAAAELVRREQAQRDALALQRQLEQEQMSRQAAAEELTRLRAQVEENRRLLDTRLEQNREARVDAERRLDALMRQYESAMSNSAANEVETLRRQVEDQQLALRAMQAREQQESQSMTTEIERLRSELENSRRDGKTSAQLVADREADVARRQSQLEALSRERDESIARATQLEQRHQAAINEAHQRRMEAEAAQQQLKQQADSARQEAAQAQAETIHAQAVAESARQDAQRARQDLENTRAEMIQRDARRVQMEGELAKLASTRRDARGLIVTLPGIFFDTGKSVLKAASKKTLDRIATQLKTDTNVKIVVEGHTDSVGSEISNQELSKARADAVRAHLVSQGVTDASILATGLGEAQPIASNKTASGKQQNRRVELVINN